MTATTTAAIAALPIPPVKPPQAVPSVTSAVSIDWGSWASQALRASESIVAAAAGGAENLVLAQIPFGTMIEMFISPAVVSSYVTQGLRNLEGMLDGQTLTATSPLETYTFNAVNAAEPELAAILGSKLLPLIQAEIAKLIPA